MTHRCTVVLVFLVSISGYSFSLGAAIQGSVYVDVNANGRLDADEPGVPGVLVSDGLHVVASDAGGRYRLDGRDDRTLLRITSPRDHAVVGHFWRWVDGQREEDFGLVRQEQPEDFLFLHISDTHIGREDLLREFAGRVVKLPVPIAFVVNTGDLGPGLDGLVPEKASLAAYLRGVAPLAVPLYHAPGNHDHVGINNANADPADPRFGIGYYEQVLGPAWHSWDWADIHFIALDGTCRVAGQAKRKELGPDQLTWLRSDLALQPRERRLVLFIHQSLADLADAEELVRLLNGRNVLAAFCGHQHRTFTAPFAGFPEYHTGMLCGNWWKWVGPNPDGTPGGFRIVQIHGGRLKTAYANREGTYPIHVAAPLSTMEPVSGTIEVQVVVIDFGKPVEATASYAGHAMPLHVASHDELWSTWRGKLDTALACDGERTLQVASRLGQETSRAEIRYLVLNGRKESYQADAPATLKIEFSEVDAADEILLNGKRLGNLRKAAGRTMQWRLAPEQLGKVNRVTIRAVAEQGANLDGFLVERVWLEYQGKTIYDPRYSYHDRHRFGDGQGEVPETDWYFCLP